MSLAAHFRRHGNTWLFVLGFILLCSLYEYGRVMNMRPFPHHLSRQTAGLSFAYTYWEKGNALFDPQQHHLFSDGLTSGRTSAECPILYYAMGQLWHITGPSEFAYRAFMLLLHFAASWALFGMLRRFLGHGGWAALAALFFFTSPAIVYFAISFMPDVPAFDLMLLGIAVLVRRWREQGRWAIAGSAVLFMLAGLLKVTALMAPLTLLALLAAETVLPKVFARNGGLFRHKAITWVALLAVFGVNYGWYSWSAAYVAEHGVSYSHSGTWALWDLPEADAARAWKAGKEVMVWQLFDTPAWIALGLMLAFIVAYARKVPRGAWLMLLCLLGGTTLYTLLWFITLDAHEYYFIIPMLLPMLLVGLFLWALRGAYPRVFTSPWTRVAFLLLIGYHAVYAANNHQMRTRGNGQFKGEDFLPLYHPGEVHFWDMVQYWNMAPILHIEPYNRSIGIERDDLVFNMSDETVCASLYLMDQRGWVNYGMIPTDTVAWNARIRAGAKYLFVHESQFNDQPQLAPYMRHQIGAFEGMRIFDLRGLNAAHARP